MEVSARYEWRLCRLICWKERHFFPAREMSSGLCRINRVQCRHNLTFHNSIYAASGPGAGRFLINMPCVFRANGWEINGIIDHFMPAHLPLSLPVQVGRRQLSGLSVFTKAPSINWNGISPHYEPDAANKGSQWRERVCDMPRNWASVGLSDLRQRRVWTIRKCTRLWTLPSNGSSLLAWDWNTTCMGLCRRWICA